MNTLSRRFAQISLFISCCGIAWVRSLPAIAETTSSQENWQRNPDLLQIKKAAPAQLVFPWLEQMQKVLIRALSSPDHARDLVNLHNSKGTKAQSAYIEFVGPIASGPGATQGPEVRQAVLKSVRLYAQKETKLDVFPAALRDGLRFNLGGASSGQSSAGIQNGNPGLRYGLVLKSIEPSPSSLKLVSTGMDDYRIVEYAPKAKLVYQIGEVYSDTAVYMNHIDLADSGPLPRQNFWSNLPGLPSYKLSGRVAPRGLPSAGNPLPPQSIFLEQSQGLYQLEAQVSGTLKQEAVLHRLRLPIHDSLVYRHELNKNLISVKSGFDGLYSNSKGLAINLERYHLENRYQLALVSHQIRHNFELVAHVPNAALEGQQFWHQHRWETRFDFSF